MPEAVLAFLQEGTDSILFQRKKGKSMERVGGRAGWVRGGWYAFDLVFDQGFEMFLSDFQVASAHVCGCSVHLWGAFCLICL